MDDDILGKIGGDPARARRVTYEKRGADWFEVTHLGAARSEHKMTAAEVRRINPIEGA